MDIKITDQDEERIREATNIDNANHRLNKLTEIVVTIAQREDQHKLEEIARHIGVRWVVGTGMTMDFETATRHLADLISLHPDADPLEHGGSESLLDELTLSERIDHDIYYACQTLYSKMLYKRATQRHNTD